MAEGGIYDQLGGGFARYSTDAHWLVPHFEKMLYDNAQLLVLVRRGLADDRRADARARACARPSPTSSAICARPRAASTPPRTPTPKASRASSTSGPRTRCARVVARRATRAADVFMRCYDVSDGGNWSDPHGHGPERASILHVVDRPQRRRRGARSSTRSRRRCSPRAQSACAPGSTTRCWPATNGLAIAGLAEAGRIFGDAAFVDGARRTAEFVLDAHDASRRAGASCARSRTARRGCRARSTITPTSPTA